jgi:hypothetical protein
MEELEDRIEADLEIESIFESVSQPRSVSLGKSLPERPGNPIINDKYFLSAGSSNSGSVGKLPLASGKLQPLNKQRKCTMDRQRRMFREHSEGLTDLLSPQLKVQNQRSSHASMSCLSELSSFESEFSKVFTDEISQEN